jgi:hypothetical protein
MNIQSLLHVSAVITAFFRKHQFILNDIKTLAQFCQFVNKKINASTPLQQCTVCVKVTLSSHGKAQLAGNKLRSICVYPMHGGCIILIWDVYAVIHTTCVCLHFTILLHIKRTQMQTQQHKVLTLCTCRTRFLQAGLSAVR